MPEFMLPEGVEIPDGSVPGDTVEFLAQVKLGEEGKAELVAIDGVVIPGYEEEEEEGEEMEEEGEEEEEEEVPELSEEEIQMMRRRQMAQGGGNSRFVQAAMMGAMQ